jgi:hypothetical protein
MPHTKVSQLTATVIEYPYNDKLLASAMPIPLVIIAALYYDPKQPGNCLNVEPHLSPLAINNKLAFIAENDTFGGNRNDPAPGCVKELKITYSYNGIQSTLTCKEKASVILHAY